VVERGGVAGGAEPLGPESSPSHNVVKSGFDDFNLVLTGQEIFTIDTFTLAVLKGIVVGPDIDEVMDTISAHVDGLGILGSTPGEVRAAVAELLQHNLALVRSRDRGKFQGKGSRKWGWF